MKIRQFDSYIREEEIASVLETLQANWITEGPKTARMIEGLKARTGARHVEMFPNGTLALFAALKVAGIGPGDEVIVPNFTFIASATSVVLTGAVPVFCDIRSSDLNIDPELIESKISERTKAIMPVHIYGQSADMDPILRTAEKHGLKIIEDAAQGIGVTFKDRHVGTLGTLGCISFFADKTITMAEGGAVLTDDPSLAESLRYFKNQGRLDRGSFIHKAVGYNFRITDLQAALGVVQLGRLDWIIEKKRALEEQYRERLKDLPLRFLQPNGFGERVPFRINVFVDNAEALADHLNRSEIEVRRIFYPLHRQPCFSPENSRITGEFPESDRAFQTGISLPSGITLTADDLDQVAESISAFFRGK